MPQGQAGTYVCTIVRASLTVSHYLRHQDLNCPHPLHLQHALQRMKIQEVLLVLLLLLCCVSASFFFFSSSFCCCSRRCCCWRNLWRCCRRQRWWRPKTPHLLWRWLGEGWNSGGIVWKRNRRSWPGQSYGHTGTIVADLSNFSLLAVCKVTFSIATRKSCIRVPVA